MLAGVTPYQSLFYTQILCGILDPILLYFIYRLATDPAVMGEYVIKGWWKWVMIATMAVITVFVVVLLQGLA
jgi:Mn2+/Fe2+ NRAMP family transporter